MIWRRLRFLLLRRRMERELAEEMAAHREQMGAPAGFGNITRLREEAADVWGWRWLDELLQDTKHSFRLFRRSPGFTLTAIVVLGLGLGCNLALFQVLDAALLTLPRLREPETMVRLFQNSKEHSSSGVAYPVTQFIKEHNSVFSSVLTVYRTRTVWGEDSSEQIEVTFVSSNFFDEIGAGAVQGRVLHAGQDDRSEAPPAVVLSYEFWQSRLGAERGVVGSIVRINGRPATVVGVATAGAYGPTGNRAQVWVPIEQVGLFYPGSSLANDWGNRNIGMYARLKPGISEAAAREALRTQMAELRHAHPREIGEEPRLDTSSGAHHFRQENDSREIKTVVALLAGVCLLILTVACANLASLMVSQMNARLSEFRMRAALGAGRARVLRQLVTESGLLVSAGAAAGWFVGYALAQTIATQTDAPFEIPLQPNLRLALGAFALAWIALLLVGLVPAWRALSQRRLAANQRSGAGFQRVLIGVQVMGSCILLLIGGAMARKLQSVVSTDVGFDFENVAVLEVSLARYGLTPEASVAYWRSLRDAANADSGLGSAALSTISPLGNTLAEAVYRDAPGLKVTTMTVDPSFLPLMKIRILAGRNLEPGDTPDSAVVISRRLAERMYGSLDVLGTSFPKSGDGPRATIVGIACDARLVKLTATNTAESYSPLAGATLQHALMLARVDSGGLESLRAAASRVNPVITPAVRWMKTDFDRRLLAPRMTSIGATALGLLGLGLTAIGIFGLVAYTISLRTKEIGIRVALGARSRGVLWLMVRDLAWPLGIGAAAGTAAVLGGLAKPLSGEPLFADPNDPIGVSVSLGLLIAGALAASLIPAARALRIDPSTALRDQ